ncbi:MAG: hypothetical protein ABIH11_05415 [Candidatus Altiarchaeota archaeon]
MELRGLALLLIIVLMATPAISQDYNADDDPIYFEETVSEDTSTTSSSTSTSSSSSSSSSSTGTTIPEKGGMIRGERMQKLVELQEDNDTGPEPEYNVVCGYTEKLCSVEKDITADGRPDCCNRENNRMCQNCLLSCMNRCGREGVGVNSCFISDDEVICECSDKPSTCYKQDTTSTLPPGTMTGSGERTGTYIIVFMLILFSAIGAILFLRNVR